MAENQGLSAKLRDHYLQIMGIVQYVPKDFAQQKEVESLVEQTPVAESLPQVTESKVSQQSAIESLLQAEPEVAPNKKPVKVAVPSDETREETSTLALQFAFWQPTDELLIATAVDGELPSSQQLNLLARVVAAIDNQSSGLPQFDLINWPPHKSMQGGEQEAREFLSTLISARLAANSTKLFLILGESAENWLLTPEQKNIVKDGLLQMTSGVTALTAPSLTQMLNQPQSKRLTWKMICQYFEHNSV